MIKQLDSTCNKNKNHKYIQYTNLLLIITLIYFIYNIRHIKSKIEYILASFLILTIIFSQLFWKNPIRQSKIHKIDAIIARIVILSFIPYTLIYKFKYSFIPILLASLVFIYFSNHYSKKEWCSNKHLLFHGLFHIFCFFATFYTFS